MNTGQLILGALALALSAYLETIGGKLPDQAWLLVGALVGAAAFKRPGDVDPQTVATVLEEHDEAHGHRGGAHSTLTQ